MLYIFSSDVMCNRELAFFITVKLYIKHFPLWEAFGSEREELKYSIVCARGLHSGMFESKTLVFPSPDRQQEH